MIDKRDDLYKDLQTVQQISIVPTMLDVICSLTGMGYAAIARVTEDRWLACSVKDNVNFGLPAGEELKIETTICSEVRHSRTEVVIDYVDMDEHYKNHHTPKMYGLQSYISFPIILRNGEFFGTLCAIDSKPVVVNRPEVLGTFRLFSELLAFHLESIELVNRSQSALKESDKILTYTNNENELYRQISEHDIQEQVRKIALFSDVLMNNIQTNSIEKTQTTAVKINAISNQLSNMMRHVTKFSEAKHNKDSYIPTNLNLVVEELCIDLKTQLSNKNIQVAKGNLPVINGTPAHLKDLMYYLLKHALLFRHTNLPCIVNIYSKKIPGIDLNTLTYDNQPINYCEITIEQTGLDIEQEHVKNIFAIFMHMNGKLPDVTYSTGLAYCRKIVQNHGGVITADYMPENGISFTIILPLEDGIDNEDVF